MCESAKVRNICRRYWRIYRITLMEKRVGDVVVEAHVMNLILSIDCVASENCDLSEFPTIVLYHNEASNHFSCDYIDGSCSSHYETSNLSKSWISQPVTCCL